jgi:hypothetical protein
LTLTLQVLDPMSTGVLHREDLMRVFNELNHYKEIAYISEARARLLFAALDASGVRSPPFELSAVGHSRAAPLLIPPNWDLGLAGRRRVARGVP